MQKLPDLKSIEFENFMGLLCICVVCICVQILKYTQVCTHVHVEARGVLLSCSHVTVLSQSRGLSLNPELTHSSGPASELLSVLPSAGLTVATTMPVFSKPLSSWLYMKHYKLSCHHTPKPGNILAFKKQAQIINKR